MNKIRMIKLSSPLFARHHNRCFHNTRSLKWFWSKQSATPSVQRREYDKNSSNVHLYSWGDGIEGQLGHGDASAFKKPELIDFLKNEKMQSISCGLQHAAVTTQNGYAYAWGGNFYMQLGVQALSNEFNYNEEAMLPEHLHTLAAVDLKQVACGYWHTMALSKEGGLYVWGNGYRGQLGVGNKYNHSDPITLKTLSKKNVIKIAGGGLHSAALTQDGRLFTWGFAKSGQLGIFEPNPADNSNPEEANDQVRPTEVEVNEIQGKITDVSCGTFHTIVLTEKGTVYTFGNGVFKGEKPSDPYSFQPSADSIPSFLPKHVSFNNNSPIICIAAGNNTNIAVSAIGEVFTWNNNAQEQRRDPLSFFHGKKAVKASISGTHCAVVTDMNELFVWPISHLQHPDPATTELLFYDEAKPTLQIHDIAVGWNFCLATCQTPSQEA